MYETTFGILQLVSRFEFEATPATISTLNAAERASRKHRSRRRALTHPAGATLLQCLSMTMSSPMRNDTEHSGSSCFHNSRLGRRAERPDQALSCSGFTSASRRGISTFRYSATQRGVFTPIRYGTRTCIYLRLIVALGLIKA